MRPPDLKALGNSMDFGIFASANRRRRRRRHARQDTIRAIFSQDYTSFSRVKMPYLREMGRTQLDWLVGPSRLRPGLTDTDSESPVFRIARRTVTLTQSCFAGVRPKAACTSLPFNFCRLTIDYRRDWFKNSIKLDPELELKLELCHLTNRFSLQWYTTPTLLFPPISPPKARLKFVTFPVNLGRQPDCPVFMP